MDFQLIIPMSGFGSRFRKAGYKIPKFLIEIEKKPVLSHILNAFPKLKRVIFICNKEDLEDKKLNLKNKLLSIKADAIIACVMPHKKGPVFSLLQLNEELDPNLKTIVNYCDFGWKWNFSLFKKHIIDTNCDGCLVSYKGFHPHMTRNTNYGYSKTNLLDVIDIREKESFTDNPMNEYASSGTYYYKNAILMKKYLNKTIENNLNTKGEYYVSMSFLPMIKDKLKVNIFEIENFLQWGTPEDLKEYIWYSNAFREKSKFIKKDEEYNNGVLLIPAAGLGKRFQEEGYLTPKPLIKVSNKYMLTQVLNYYPEFKFKHFVLRKEMQNVSDLIAKLKSRDENSQFNLIKSKTNGQLISCLKAIDNINLKLPLTIGACDSGMLYDKNKLKKLFNDKSIDIIVWGSEGYPGAIHNPEMYSWVNHKNGKVNEILEKKVSKNKFKDPALIGTFSFSSGSLFLDLANELINDRKMINNEFYVDSCVNCGIKKGLKVIYFKVDYFLCWGTPNDLMIYNYWQDYFDKNIAHPYTKQSDMDYA